MKNSIILPSDFEKVFMIEARKEGFIKHIDIGEDYAEFDDWEESLYSKHYKTRKKVFQMLLLYDEIILDSADPTYEYDRLCSSGNFSIYSFDDFMQYDPIHAEGHLEFANYLKPAIIPIIKKYLKKYIPFLSKNISYNKVASELYDVTLKLKNHFNKNIEEVISFNKIVFDLNHQPFFEEMDRLGVPNAINRNRFYTDLAQLIICEYEKLCWQLEISSQRNSYIINCDYQLSKIGCDEYGKDINPYLESYRLLKCECSSIIEALPKMDSLYDVFNLKEKRKNDINNLRDVLEQLEYTMRNEGREQAIKKASKDVKKAALSLQKRNELSPIGKWTTLLSVPVGIAELLCGLPPIGLGISALGTGAYMVDKYIEKKNSWCEILR